MKAKHLVIAAAVALLSAPVCAQSVKAGIEAWQKADYSAAVAIWRPLAMHGDPDAEFNLGQAYRLGRGVPLDLGVAKTWFEKAAGAGHLDSQTTLGLLLFQNGDRAEGLKWLKRAAEGGEPRAQLVYGTALYNGDGVPQDHLLGYAYVSRAAGQGLAPARDTLDQLDNLLSETDKRKAMLLAQAAPKPEPKVAVARPPAQRPVRTAQVKAPSPKPVHAAPRAAPVTAGHGNWRIQLGAFSQRSSAEALYRRLADKSGIAGRSAAYVPAGPIIRLQVGPFQTKAAAAAVCGSLGTACFPVPVK